MMSKHHDRNVSFPCGAQAMQGLLNAGLSPLEADAIGNPNKGLARELVLQARKKCNPVKRLVFSKRMPDGVPLFQPKDAYVHFGWKTEAPDMLTLEKTFAGCIDSCRILAAVVPAKLGNLLKDDGYGGISELHEYPMHKIVFEQTLTTKWLYLAFDFDDGMNYRQHRAKLEGLGHSIPPAAEVVYGLICYRALMGCFPIDPRQYVWCGDCENGHHVIIKNADGALEIENAFGDDYVFGNGTLCMAYCPA